MYLYILTRWVICWMTTETGGDFLFSSWKRADGWPNWCFRTCIWLCYQTVRHKNSIPTAGWQRSQGTFQRIFRYRAPRYFFFYDLLPSLCSFQRIRMSSFWGPLSSSVEISFCTKLDLFSLLVCFNDSTGQWRCRNHCYHRVQQRQP